MATGTTTSSNFTVSPQVLLECVREGIQGMRVLGTTGIVQINSSLPADKRQGETITVPFLMHIGEWKEYNENDPIDVTQMQDSNETSSVARSGKAFTMTDMARVLRGYASPMEAGREMLQEGLATWVERKSIAAMTTLGVSRPAIVVNVHSASTPRYYDLDLHIAVRSRFGDELRNMAGTVMHSQAINRMLLAKDADGNRLNKLLTQDDENGVYVFEGMGRFYASDLMPVEYTVVSTGTTPPVLTLTGNPKGMYDQIRVECTTLGAFGTAQIRISTDGGTSWVASAITVPVSGVVDRTDDLGLLFTFATGTFAANNVYTSRGKTTSVTAKKGAVVFWHNNFGDGGAPEEQRDVLRKNTIVAADVLGVVHAYKKLNGSTRPGLALAQFNI